MAPFLDANQRDQVLEEALALGGGRGPYQFLLQAYRVAPQRIDLLERAIEAARLSADAFSRKIAIVEPASVVPVDRIDELLVLAYGAGTPEDQAEVLLELAARLPEQRRQVLATQAFALLADGEDFRGAGVTAVKKRARAVRLLPPAQRGRAAIAVVDELDRLKLRHYRVAALADVLPFLDGARRTRAEALAYELSAELKASDIGDLVDESGRGLWLAKEAPEFFQPLVANLLTIARKEVESYPRTSAIGALLPLSIGFTCGLSSKRRINGPSASAMPKKGRSAWRLSPARCHLICGKPPSHRCCRKLWKARTMRRQGEHWPRSLRWRQEHSWTR